MRKAKTAVLATLLLILVGMTLCGCVQVDYSAANFPASCTINSLPIKVSPEGVKYRIITIEGHKYIVTQTSNQYYNFSYLPED
jgi:hypothetical protein